MTGSGLFHSVRSFARVATMRGEIIVASGALHV
jgi:hypothetical protein